MLGAGNLDRPTTAALSQVAANTDPVDYPGISLLDPDNSTTRLHKNDILQMNDPGDDS